MPFDWKKAEQDDKAREQQVMVTVGISFIALGIGTTLLRLTTGHPDDWWSASIMTFIGVVSLVTGLVMRRRHQVAAPPST